MTIVWQENDILRHLLEVGFTNAPNSSPKNQPPPHSMNAAAV
jgi:hypothetical protein